VIGQRIEQESFRIIHGEIGAHGFSEDQLAIVVRIIHATADFDFKETIRFHPAAIQSGVEALRRGCTVITDVRMVEVGISSRLLNAFGGKTICLIGAPEVAELAEREGLTRSTAAMRLLGRELNDNIVAIGNAPTALLEIVRLIWEEGIRPALVIGVPVGFVNTAESKEQLLGLDVPYITAVGRKGGSTVAVATVNALLRLARQ
jgi:precorrin-8X/cobalt-precorrin-8 methylmutase